MSCADADFRSHPVDANGKVSQEACAEIGGIFMQSLQAIMQEATFEEFGWCYRCRSRCPFYGPPDISPSMFRLVVAGSTCTSWSRMGKRKHWAAFSAVAFSVWAYTTLRMMPDAIIHECTEDFDVSILRAIFGALYFIATLVFSPCDLGIPSSRPRRYTLLLLRTRCQFALPYDLPSEDFSR